MSRLQARGWRRAPRPQPSAIHDPTEERILCDGRVWGLARPLFSGSERAPRTALRARSNPAPYSVVMCRSIKTLHRHDEPPTPDEIEAAALQFVRKISGYRAPSRANTAVFDAAVAEVTAASRRMLETLTPR